MDAVVLGGTGLVGRLLVQELSKTEQYERILLISRKNIDSQSKKISTILIKDLNEIRGLKLQLNEPVFFCCIGSTIKEAGSEDAFRKVDYQAVVDFAELAKQQNVLQFSLVSAKGSDPKSPFFYNRTKGDAEAALLNMNLNSVTVFKPGLLLGDRNESRFFESVAMAIAKKLETVLGQNKLKPFVTPAQVLAKTMVDDSLVRKSGYKLVDSSEI
jgi:nucleoside-diphosphate-sugar epimerase